MSEQFGGTPDFHGIEIDERGSVNVFFKEAEILRHTYSRLMRQFSDRHFPVQIAAHVFEGGQKRRRIR